MEAANPSRVLRLVGADVAPSLHLSRAASAAPESRRAEARRAVERENASAAGLSAHDARAILARRVGESIDGGRAAVLAPERREALLGLATRLGMRPFDASLVIAIVQDRARAGEPVTGGAAVDERLAMVRSMRPGERRADRHGRDLLLALVVGAVLTALLAFWVVRG